MTDSHGPDSSKSTTASSCNVDSTASTLLGSRGSSATASFEKRGGAEIEMTHLRGEMKRDQDSFEDARDSMEAEGARSLCTRASTEAQDRETPTPSRSARSEPVSWSQLPRKSQLTILTLARLAEPLSQTSLQAYMFYQLKSFHAPDTPPPSDATVSSQAGLLTAAFTGAQFLTAILWGHLADSEKCGRKRVIFIGLVGTAIGSLGFGFSQSFAQAMFWRAFGGFLNGNIGVMRTMISEIIREKKYQSRAFLLLPMCFNVGVVIGPLIGGLLADPVQSWPSIFGAGGVLGGEDGVWWLKNWPFALPNIVNAGFLVSAAALVWFGLEETLESLRGKHDWGLRFGRWLVRTVLRKEPHQYRAVGEDDSGEGDLEMAGHPKETKSFTRRKLPFKKIWTKNVMFTLLAHGLLAFHVGNFNNLWFVFLSTPRYDPNNTTTAPPTQSSSSSSTSSAVRIPPNYKPHLPFTFTGGLALPPPSIGTALAILGVIGLTLQLFLYPPLSFRLGTVRSYRLSLCLFPLASTLAPFLAILPSSNPPPGQASGFFIWAAITTVLAIQVLARTFALPAAAILINNSSPHPSVLGTIHGIAQSVSSGMRTIGPVLAGWVYGVGLGKGMVGLAWWCMTGVTAVGAISSLFVREGNGHEVLLDGEEDEVTSVDGEDANGGIGRRKG